jgi:hypothetical protein
MAATPLSTVTRYFPVGLRQYYFVASISNKAAPTRSELNAGIDLTTEVTTVTGFSTATALVDAPDLKTRFTSQVSGMITADASSMNIYLDEDSVDVRTVLPRDTTGFIVQFPEGDDEGVSGTKTMDVFPVTVSSAVKETTTTDVGQVMISFAITSEPAENVLVPSS